MLVLPSNYPQFTGEILLKRELTLDEIREHWKNWATSYGTDLRATTKASTAKRIELNTLVKTVKSIQDSFSDEPKLLEIGCGNGHNLIALHERFPHFRLLGIDYIEEMIESAEKLRVERGISTESVEFRVGNVLNLENLSADYDLVYTVSPQVDPMGVKGVAWVGSKGKAPEARKKSQVAKYLLK